MSACRLGPGASKTVLVLWLHMTQSSGIEISPTMPFHSGEALCACAGLDVPESQETLDRATGPMRDEDRNEVVDLRFLLATSTRLHTLEAWHGWLQRACLSMTALSSTLVYFP